MAENKTKMKVVKDNVQQDNKPSYEALEHAFMQLTEKYNNATRFIQQHDMQMMLKRLDYCFKVLEHSDKFNSDFVLSCSEEIMTAMNTKEENNDTNQAE